MLEFNQDYHTSLSDIGCLLYLPYHDQIPEIRAVAIAILKALHDDCREWVQTIFLLEGLRISDVASFGSALRILEEKRFIGTRRNGDFEECTIRYDALCDALVSDQEVADEIAFQAFAGEEFVRQAFVDEEEIVLPSVEGEGEGEAEEARCAA